MPDPISTGSGARAAKARHSQPGTIVGSTPEDENNFDINDPVQVQDAINAFTEENAAQHEKIQDLQEELVVQADQYKAIIARLETRLSSVELMVQGGEYPNDPKGPVVPVPSNPQSRGRSLLRASGHEQLVSKPHTRSPSLRISALQAWA